MPRTEAGKRLLGFIDAAIEDATCSCRACVTRTKETYDLPGSCLNCGCRFTVRIRKGDRAPLYVTCPHCETSAFGWRRHDPA